MYLKITHASLFSGIGGFDLAAEHCGMQNVLHCEWNTFGRRVLNYYWPKAASYGDITQTDFTIHRGTIDVLSGGFPCQPYSVAGKRLGNADERHLWPQMLRAIREIQPGYVVGENVSGLVNWSRGLVFDEVQADLENEGYEILPFILPAAGQGAPHIRHRVFFVAFNAAYARSFRHRRGIEQSEPNNAEEQPLHSHISDYGDGIWREATRCCSDVADTANARIESLQQRWENGICGFGNVADSDGSRLQRREQNRLCESKQENQRGARIRAKRLSNYGNAADTDGGRLAGKEHGQTQAEWFAENGLLTDWSDFPTQSPVCSRNDGFSSQLDGITVSKWTNESIKAYGNAVVPQVVIPIFKSIISHLNQL